MSSQSLPFAHRWREAAIGEVADVIVGGTPSTAVPSFWGGDVRWMSSGDVHLRHIFDVPGRITEKGLEHSNAVMVEPEAVAIALAGQGRTRGTVALTHIAICTNQSVALIKADGVHLDSTFLYQSLIPRYEEMRSRSAGGGRAGLSKQILVSTPVQLPPLSEQRKIARILTTVDDLIEKTEALIAKYQAIKQGMMHDLFTRGVDEHGQLRPTYEEAPNLYKQSELGWIPKEWEQTSVASEFLIATGFTLGAHRRPIRQCQKYLRVANVQRDEIRLDDLAELEATQDEFQARCLEPNDLLVVEGHADPRQIGRCALVTREAAGITFQNHLFRLRSIRLNPRFACDWLNSDAARRYWLCRCATSSGLNTINQAMLRRLPCVVPPPQEQERIGERSVAHKVVIQNAIASLSKFRQIKCGLMQDLLTGKVRAQTDDEDTPNV